MDKQNVVYPYSTIIFGNKNTDTCYNINWASLVAQLVKNLPAMQETWVQSLGWEDPLEKKRLLTPVFWPGDCVVHGLQIIGHD